ncbi:MAG: inorganic phosphate transporter, partial [Nitrospinae bacterium]|nr:inorganic phosphate transporter [Nitrospinota bacterium]
MACNIGANDVANAMGTSVGSKALTFKQAIMIAAVAEFIGAFFVGGHVSDTIRKGMLDPTVFEAVPYHLVYGMISALIAAALWLHIASSLGWPVSTTHSIVGGVVGFGIIAGGMDVINWGKIGQVGSRSAAGAMSAEKQEHHRLNAGPVIPLERLGHRVH